MEADLPEPSSLTAGVFSSLGSGPATFPDLPWCSGSSRDLGNDITASGGVCGEVGCHRRGEETPNRYSQPLLVHHSLDSDGPLLRVNLAHTLKGNTPGETH